MHTCSVLWARIVVFCGLHIYMDHAENGYLHWLVAVACEVLSEQANDEAAPESSGDAEEHVPVAHEPGGILSEDAREGCWERAVGDSEHSLQTRNACSTRHRASCMDAASD